MHALCLVQYLSVQSVYSCSAVFTVVYSYLAPGWPQICHPITAELQASLALIGPLEVWRRWRWRWKIAMCWHRPLGNEGAGVKIEDIFHMLKIISKTRFFCSKMKEYQFFTLKWNSMIFDWWMEAWNIFLDKKVFSPFSCMFLNPNHFFRFEI